MKKILLSQKGDIIKPGYSPAFMMYKNNIERPFVALDEICEENNITRQEALKEPFTFDHVPFRLGFLTSDEIKAGDELYIPIWVKKNPEPGSYIIPEPDLTLHKKATIKEVEYTRESNSGGGIFELLHGCS